MREYLKALVYVEFLLRKILFKRTSFDNLFLEAHPFKKSISKIREISLFMFGCEEFWLSKSHQRKSNMINLLTSWYRLQSIYKSDDIIFILLHCYLIKKIILFSLFPIYSTPLKRNFCYFAECIEGSFVSETDRLANFMPGWIYYFLCRGLKSYVIAVPWVGLKSSIWFSSTVCFPLLEIIYLNSFSVCFKSKKVQLSITQNFICLWISLNMRDWRLILS